MNTPDMSITVGHIISNPEFDVNCEVAITSDLDQEEILHESYGGTDCPVELLIKPVSYITIRNDKLIIEAKMEEE